MKNDGFRIFACFASSWSWFSFPLQPFPRALYAACSSSMILLCDVCHFKKNFDLIRPELTDLEILLVLLPLDLDFLFLCNLFLLHCMQHALRQWSYFVIWVTLKKFQIDPTRIDRFGNICQKSIFFSKSAKNHDF